MKIGVITGASSGMGRDFVLELDKEGLDELWVVARRGDRLEQLQGECQTPVRCLVADLTEEKGRQTLISQLEQHAPCVQFLVNCAGFGKFGGWDEIPLAAQLSMVDLNAKALVAVTQTTLPFMHRGSHIVQLCSSSAFFPLPYLNVYAATKAFVQHYSFGLYEELKDDGISVTQVSPGWVKTEFFDGFQQEDGKHHLKKYSPIYPSCKVVQKALQDAKKGKQVSVYGAFVKFHRLAGRFAPRWFMNGQWRSCFQ